MHKYSTQATTTLALRIRAARRRYVLICDKNALPFEISLFPSSFFAVLSSSDFFFLRALYIFVYFGWHCVVVTIICLPIDKITFQLGENPLAILKNENRTLLKWLFAFLQWHHKILHMCFLFHLSSLPVCVSSDQHIPPPHLPKIIWQIKTKHGQTWTQLTEVYFQCDYKSQQ